MIGSFLLSCALLAQAGDAPRLAQAGDVPKASEKAPDDTSAVSKGDRPSDEQLAGEVRSLLRKLRSRRTPLAEREEIELQLVKLGPRIMEMLPELGDDDDAETKLRLGRVRDKLQRQIADAAGKATRVTLKGTMPLSKVLAAISKQTGNEVVDYRKNFNQEADDKDITVDFADTPFWKAVDTVADLAGLTVYGYPEGDSVALVNRGDGESPRGGRPVSYSGPFRVEVVQLTSRRSLRNPDDRVLQLQLEASWEPRLKPISIRFPIEQLSAEDEQGNAISVRGQRSPGSEITPGTFTAELSIPLELPSRDAKRIAHLRGKLVALAPGRVETFRFEKLKVGGPPIDQKRAGVTVSLDRVRKNNETWEFRVIVGFEKASGALQSHRGWIYNNACYLEDSDGKPIANDLFETVRQTENQVGVAYYFDLPNGPADLTLVYKTPAVIMTLPLDIEIKDLELP